jgi:hypothetical protein
MKLKIARTLGALIGLLILACAVARVADAASIITPSVLTYQGRLKENSAPVTGTRSVDIKVCDALTGGNCYSDTGPQNVTVANGLFRSTFTMPGAVNLAAPPFGQYYLEVQVGATALVPREALTVSPYAIDASSSNYAIAALSATNLQPNWFISTPTVSGNLYITGNYVGIGANPPLYTLDFGNSGDKIIGAEDNAGANGSTVTLRAGGGGTGGAGGALVLAAGAGNAAGAAGYVEIQGGNGVAHLRVTQAAGGVSASPNGNCGGGASAGTYPNSTDMAGSFFLTTGGAPVPTIACAVNVNYAKTYSRSPKIVLLTPTNNFAAQSGVFVSTGASSAASFNMGFSVAPTPSAILTWNYLVVE